jgi:hypothetical protein
MRILVDWLKFFLTLAYLLDLRKYLGATGSKLADSVMALIRNLDIRGS